MRSFRPAAALLLSLASLATASEAWAIHHHCKRCVPCCCPQCSQAAERGAEELRPRAAEPVVRAAVVQSMPMYTMPMMYAAMPVMPAMAPQTRSAEPRGGDCCERVDKLEAEMLRLSQSMRDLQTIVAGQTEILKVLANRPDGVSRGATITPDQTPNEAPLQPVK